MVLWYYFYYYYYYCYCYYYCCAPTYYAQLQGVSSPLCV